MLGFIIIHLITSFNSSTVTSKYDFLPKKQYKTGKLFLVVTGTAHHQQGEYINKANVCLFKVEIRHITVTESFYLLTIIVSLFCLLCFSQMGSSNPEISIEVFPYLRVHKDGSVERLAGTAVVPAGLDSETNVVSKDIVVIPETGVSARLYVPNFTTTKAGLVEKLPLLIYYHGGAFCISSAGDPLYHKSLNNLVAEANVVAVSINYRLAPEHPLPTAYEDSWAALQWIASHANKEDREENHESWIKDKVDFERVFLAGDSAGANIAHFMALRLQLHDPDPTKGFSFKVSGVVLVNPYFWGEEPIGVEISDRERKVMVDTWWDFVCPSEKGNDDPMINPFVDGAPSLEGLGCEKVLVIVAENDILRERGKLYHTKLVSSGWKGKAEFYETQGEDHVFHIFNPNCDKAKFLIKRIASFVNHY